MDNIKRFGASHNICILCPQRLKLKVVPRKQRQAALKTARIYIPNGARLCPSHFEIYSWDVVAPNAVICEYTANQIEDMLDLALCKDETSTDLSNIDIESNTGLTCAQFDELFTYVPSLVEIMRTEKAAKWALFMLLMRFKTAASYAYIGSRCGVSGSKASIDIQRARFALTRDFVPKYFGFRNLGRYMLLQNTTSIARIIHAGNNPEVLMTISDGTYIYVNKSANQEFQKVTYNKQKSRNFLRPMMCVTTNGLIIDIFGPFEATKNDAKCMKELLEHNADVREEIQAGDVFIFDRGFRDCLQDVANRGCVVKIPEFV